MLPLLYCEFELAATFPMTVVVWWVQVTLLLHIGFKYFLVHVDVTDKNVSIHQNIYYVYIVQYCASQSIRMHIILMFGLLNHIFCQYL